MIESMLDGSLYLMRGCMDLYFEMKIWHFTVTFLGKARANNMTKTHSFKECFCVV